MIKEAIQHIIELANTRVVKVNGQEYSTQKMHLIQEPTPSTIEVNSLTGLVDYLISNFDGEKNLMVHVKSPTEVEVFSEVDNDMKRDEWITAKAMLPTFRFDNWYDSENFIIKLQSCFVQNEDRDIMLKVVGNIKEEDVRTTGDDGVSQVVTAKTGVATVGNVKVPNPVVLSPFRTFVEVEQPESDFIFRMQSGPRCALFEADGGAWKLKAMQNIKDFLTAALEEEIEAKKVFIIA